VEEKKRLGTIKENEVLVQRKKDIILNNATQTITVPFRIVDQPLKLQPNEWYGFYIVCYTSFIFFPEKLIFIKKIFL
jgi:RNA pol II accessory factor, Cdc73 family.